MFNTGVGTGTGLNNVECHFHQGIQPQKCLYRVFGVQIKKKKNPSKVCRKLENKVNKCTKDDLVVGTMTLLIL